MSTSRRIYQSESTVTDLRTGEAVHHQSHNVVRLPQEPAYVKLYVQDLGDLIGLTDNEKAVLYMLATKIDFDGIASLNAASRKRIAASCGISNGSFRNAISGLCRKNIMHRIEPNEYEVDPRYFAKGKWRDILHRRQDFELRVRYRANGEREVSTRGLDPDED